MHTNSKLIDFVINSNNNLSINQNDSALNIHSCLIIYVM